MYSSTMSLDIHISDLGLDIEYMSFNLPSALLYKILIAWRMSDIRKRFYFIH